MPWGLLLRFGPWLALGIAALTIWGLYGRLEAATIRAKNAEAVVATREDDAKRSAEAIAKLADTLAKTEAKVITVTERIYSAPQTRDCAASPSMRAASDGLRELFPGGGEKDPGRQPSAKLY